MRFVYLSGIILLLSSCTENRNGVRQDYHPFYAPKEGTIIAADSVHIDEEAPNDFYYAVQIVSTNESEEGKYNLQAHFGHNEAETKIVYPLLDKPLTPGIRVDDSEKYSYIIGFTFDGDSVFHDYAKLYAKHQPLNTQIEFKYLRAYYVDSVAAE